MTEFLWNSFNRTILEADRWMLIVNGLNVTLLISVLSIVFGTVVGYLTVIARYQGAAWARKLVNVYQTILRGQPLVVVLLVMYYIVFAHIEVSGEFVAVVAFSLSLGASTGGVMWEAVTKVNRVQEETGLALGYSRKQVFKRVILPMAAHDFMPSVANLYVRLVRDTSVVGYIAVNDLTHAIDLIRSRTMDAFFPIVITAVIYFVLCRLLGWGLKRLALFLDVTNRKARVIEGVNL